MSRLLLILFAMLFSASIYAQTDDDYVLDSLGKVYHSMSYDDINRMDVCAEIARLHYNVDSTIKWSDTLLQLSEKYKSEPHRYYAYIYLAWAAYYKLDYTTTFNYYYKALFLANDLGDYSKKGIAFANLVDVYRYVKNYSEAEACADSALAIFKANGDSLQIITVNRYMACVYDEQMIYDLVNSTLQNNIHIDSLLHDNEQLLIDLQFIIESKLQHYGFFADDGIELVMDAKEYCRKASMVPTSDILSRKSIINFYNKSLYYEFLHFNYTGLRRRDLLDSMRTMCLQETELANQLGTAAGHINSVLSWVNYNVASQRFREAKLKLDSLESCDLDSSMVLPLCMAYRDYYIQIGDYKSAIPYINQIAKDRLNSSSPANAVKYTKSIEKEKYDILQRERDVKERTRKIIFISVIIVITLVLIFVALAFYHKRSVVNILNGKNSILMQQTEEILWQKEEIQHQKDEIEKQNVSISKINSQLTDSINYASLIQKAALPKDDYMRELFCQYFIIYRPLQIVAGDFYWASRVGKYRILVCADCTGHGVPGAFVSMLGISLLNEVSSNIVADSMAAGMLNVLRAKLMHALGQSKKKYEHGAVYSMDGMDLSMIVFEDGSDIMQYAGAYRPLWIWRNGEIIQYKPDKMPIGLYLGVDKDFTNHEIQVLPGDMLYMFSDGIPDQFGYTNNQHTECRHYSSKRLAQFLSQIGGLPVEEQRRLMETEIDAWRNGYRQLDDNILLGIRI